MPFKTHIRQLNRFTSPSGPQPAALVLALVMIVPSLELQQGAEAARSLLIKKVLNARPLYESQQLLNHLHEKAKNPYKKTKSSSRRVPLSRSNPTQNK